LKLNRAIEDILNSKFKLSVDHFIAMSEFFEHCHTASKSMPFLKTLDIWSIVVLIYKNQLLSLPCSYQFLESRCRKSEGSLYRTLRDGVNPEFLGVIKVTFEIRERCYIAADLGISSLGKLKNFGE
jgi:hypothetical protein